MPKLVIYGTGLIAEVADFYFRSDSAFDVVAFTNGGEFIKETSLRDRPVVPFEEVAAIYPPGEHAIFVALGYAKTNRIRQARVADAKAKGYACASYVSSRALCFGEARGENCFILENNVIQPFVCIGSNVTLWSGNHIGHHSRIGDNCFVSSHVVVSGACEIGDNCFLGVNATIQDNVKLGAFAVISPGAVVKKDCPERSVVQPPDSTGRIIPRDVI
jgi:sugar O-acyltransferase (sialic acid O-acetyltransferase NeuD family)